MYKNKSQIIMTEKLAGQYKHFYIDYTENRNGRFVKITEKDGRVRSTVIVPEEAISEFAEIFTKIAKVNLEYLDSKPVNVEKTQEANLEPESEQKQDLEPEQIG